MIKKQGYVRWFKPAFGYGFITSPGETDIFVHYSAIDTDSKYKNLRKGQKVSFTAEMTPLGLRATQVKVCDAG